MEDSPDLKIHVFRHSATEFTSLQAPTNHRKPIEASTETSHKILLTHNQVSQLSSQSGPRLTSPSKQHRQNGPKQDPIPPCEHTTKLYTVANPSVWRSEHTKLCPHSCWNGPLCHHCPRTEHLVLVAQEKTTESSRSKRTCRENSGPRTCCVSAILVGRGMQIGQPVQVKWQMAGVEPSPKRPGGLMPQ